MDGGIGCGVGVDNEPSPRRAAIEKTQAELRQEFVVREQRRRELEFLEKGGNPLDFKIVSLSSSQADPLAEQNLASEAKSSFALNASPNRESAESNGRPYMLSGRDLNTADNFAGDAEVIGTERTTVSFDQKEPGVQEGLLSQLDGSQIEAQVKESEDSGGVRMGVKGYARRNRHRSNRSSGSSCIRDTEFNGEDKSQTLLNSIKCREVDIQTKRETPLNVATLSSSKLSVLDENGMPGTFASKEYEGTDLGEQQAPEASVDASSKPLEERNLGFKDCVYSENAQSECHLKDTDMDCVITSKNLLKSNNIAKIDNELSGHMNAKENTDLPSLNSALSEQSKEPFVCKNEDQSLLKDEEGDNSAYDVITAKFNCVKTSENASIETHDVHGQRVSSDKATLSKRMSTGTTMNTSRETAVSNHNNFVVNGKADPTDEIQTLGNSDVKFKSEEGSPASMTSALQKESPRASACQDDKPNLLAATTNEKKANSDLGVSVSIEKPSAGPPNDIVSISTTTNNAIAGITKDAANDKAQLSDASKAIEKSKGNNVRGLKYITKPEKKPKEPKRGMFYWDVVLNEMTWMANDFMQERRWKMALAAQLSHGIQRMGGECLKKNVEEKQRKKARRVASSIWKFWCDAKTLPYCECADPNRAKHEGVNSENIEALNMGYRGNKTCKKSPLQHYAMRALMDLRKVDVPIQGGPLLKPEKSSDVLLSSSLEDTLHEETLFYNVPDGAMTAYRSYVESYWASHNHEEMTCDKSIATYTAYDGRAGFQGSNEVTGLFRYEVSKYADDTHSHSGISPSEKKAYGDEHDRYFCCLPVTLDGSKGAKARKKRKSLMKASMPKTYAGRISGESYEVFLGNKMEANSFTPSSTTNGKRVLPSGNLNIATIPTKRIRSSTVAARQRVGGTFSGGIAGGSSIANRTDVSSGDTSSLQEDLNTMSGGSQHLKGIDMDPSVACGKHWIFDGDEMSVKTKKKKKAKHLGVTSSFSPDPAGNIGSAKSLDYENKWQHDVTSSLDQREQTKRKAECPSYSLTNLSGSAMDHQRANSQAMIAQPATKKQKVSKQISDMSPEIGTPANLSAASPAASQLSNMSNPNKLMKMVPNRDRGRKIKVTGKIASSDTAMGIPWSTFEDQALVVLVHDFGPNWDLVSDIINSSLQIKSIFRKPTDCKERHKCLMEKSGGDGGDSVEDSGSSQHYQSTLPGIPKGSARMLLQRLQGPMEEETLKTHFEKIVQAGQKHHTKKSQNDNQEQKHTQVHPSHLQVIAQLPTGLLTPLDLCDQAFSHSEHIGPYPLGAISPVPPASGGISSVQGTTNLPPSANMASASATISPVAAQRDVQHRFTSMRPMSVNIDEQQRLQQYNQMVSARNIQPTGMISGLNRGMPLSRPGFPGFGSPPILNMASSGLNNMLSSVGVGLPVSSTITSGPVTAQGNLMSKSRDTIQMLRPGQTSEDQRQILMQEFQLQAVQGNGQVVSPFSNQATSFSNHMASSPTPTFSSSHQHQITQPHNSLHHSQVQGSNHNPRQTFMIRPQMRQHFVQPQFPSLTQTQSNAISQTPHTMSAMPNHCHQQQSPMSHVLQHQHANLPQTSKPQNSTVHQQTAATTMLQSSQKRPLSHPQTLGQNSSGLSQSNQMQKQLQQRQQQQQKHQSPLQQHKNQIQGQQQQIKALKGFEGGSVMLQNLHTETAKSNVSQNSLSSGQHVEKKEQNAHSGHSQRVFTGTTSHQSLKQTVQPGMSLQQGQSPGQVSGNLVQSATLSHQQKGHSQQSVGKQQHASLTTENYQTSVSSPMASQTQQQLPICQHQTSSVSTPTIVSTSQQQRQLLPNQQPGPRKTALRQIGADVGGQSSPQPNKASAQQKDQHPQQISSPQVHLAFQVGSNVGSSLSTINSGSVVPIVSTTNSSTTAVNASQWKSMQNIPSTNVCSNLSNHCSVSSLAVSSAACSSGMMPASLNGNMALQGQITSSMISSTTTMAGTAPRQYIGQVGSSHDQNVAVHAGMGAMPSHLMGTQWQSQQQIHSLSSQQQQRQGHSGLQNSHNLGSTFVDPPTSAPM